MQGLSDSEEQITKHKMVEERFAEVMEGRRVNSAIYVIEGYMYSKEKFYLDRMSVRCVHFKRKCNGRAIIDKDSLRIYKIRGQHSCDQWMDPDWKVQIAMESKMKDLAMTSKDSLRKIYDDVCLENPAVGARIPYCRIEGAMRVRRNKSKCLN